jgi:hypothetical protein
LNYGRQISLARGAYLKQSSHVYDTPNV